VTSLAKTLLIFLGANRSKVFKSFQEYVCKVMPTALWGWVYAFIGQEEQEQEKEA
jgi:hypothetical protein